MKKTCFCILLLVISVAAFGQIKLSAGAQAGYLMSALTYKYTLDADNWMKMTQTDNILGFGVFADATYVRLGLEYGRAVSATQKDVLCIAGSESESTADSPDGYYMNLLNIVLLGKYPLAIGPITLWPTAGVMYSMLLSADSDGDGVPDDLTNVAMNDFYLVGGCGVDFPITQNVFLTGSALFNWNLMPIPEEGYTPDPEESFTQWWITVRLGVGFSF